MVENFLIIINFFMRPQKKGVTCECGVVNGVVCRGNGRLAGDRCTNGGGCGC